MREETIEMFGVLREEAEYQYDTLGNVKESLISLIELHINTVSLDMNRTMRLLAVITALSLIPAIIGGMLGENLVDQPYNVKLWEVFLVVLSMMGLGFYAFWRKGWLR
jgi:Mg2+ and Co2+ transporter CorA